MVPPAEKPKSGSIIIKSQLVQNIVAMATTLAIIGGCGAYLRKDMIAWGDTMLARMTRQTATAVQIHDSKFAHDGMTKRAESIEEGLEEVTTEVRLQHDLTMQQGFEIRELQKDQKEGFAKQSKTLDKILEKLPK